MYFILFLVFLWAYVYLGIRLHLADKRASLKTPHTPTPTGYGTPTTSESPYPVPERYPVCPACLREVTSTDDSLTRDGDVYHESCWIPPLEEWSDEHLAAREAEYRLLPTDTLLVRALTRVDMGHDQAERLCWRIAARPDAKESDRAALSDLMDDDVLDGDGQLVALAVLAPEPIRRQLLLGTNAYLDLCERRGES